MCKHILVIRVNFDAEFFVLGILHRPFNLVCLGTANADDVDSRYTIEQGMYLPFSLGEQASVFIRAISFKICFAYHPTKTSNSNVDAVHRGGVLGIVRLDWGHFGDGNEEFDNGSPYIYSGLEQNQVHAHSSGDKCFL